MLLFFLGACSTHETLADNACIDGAVLQVALEDCHPSDCITDVHAECSARGRGELTVQATLSYSTEGACMTDDCGPAKVARCTPSFDPEAHTPVHFDDATRLWGELPEC